VCRVYSPLLAIALALAGCGTGSTAAVEYRHDGTIALRCRTSLPRCLERAEDACHGTRYEVLSAIDDHADLGSAGVPVETETRSSQAIVRCGPKGWSLFRPTPKDAGTDGP